MRLTELWRGLHPGDRGADAIDARLHGERLDGRSRRLHDATLAELPDGAFVLDDGAPRLVRRGGLLTWTPAGYTDRSRPRAGGAVRVLTPPSLVELLRSGFEGVVPLLHPSAGRAAAFPAGARRT